MFCSKCGKGIPDVDFCPFCGFKNEYHDGKQSNNPVYRFDSSDAKKDSAMDRISYSLGKVVGVIIGLSALAAAVFGILAFLGVFD